MNSKYKIDLATWKRKEHFNFFSKFEQPFFGVCTSINCTKAYQYCKTYNVSFFLFYLYHSLRVANKVPEFKLRIEDEGIYEYKLISGSITVMRSNQTFGFIYFNYETDFTAFANNVKRLINEEKSNMALRLDFDSTNLIHYSVLPGINFSSLQHAHTLNNHAGVPKIVFGKYQFINGQVFLPLAVHVHHGLCDGLHVETYINMFQASMELAH